ncbi:MAG: alpha/beta hydrolase [Pseudomonadota bacterium]
MSEGMILLHGVGLDRHIFADLRAELVVNTHAYDLRGSGEGPPWVGAASLSQFAQDLWAEADALGWDCFALCGFSMGAMIAQYAALERSERVSHLVLLNAVYDRTQAQRDAVAARLTLAQEQGPAEIIEGALARWFTADFSPPDLVAKTRARLESNDADQFLRNYEMFSVADQQISGRLSFLSMPVFVATGALDQGSSPEMTQGMAAVIPNAHAKVYAGAAHFLPLQYPKQLAQDIANWMEAT